MSPLSLAVVQRRMSEAEALLDRTGSPEVRANCARIIRQCRYDLGWTTYDTAHDYTHAEPEPYTPYPAVLLPDTRAARLRSDERTVKVAGAISVVAVSLFLLSLSMLAGLL